MSLAKRHAFGLVESVVLIGAPTPSTSSDWREMRSVVASRLVNVYSQNDYVLGFLYRTSSVQYGIAGLQKIEGLPSVENVDVSETVSGHLRYRYLVGSILSQIGFEGLDPEAVTREQGVLKQMDEEEEKKTYVEEAKAAGQKVIYGPDGKIVGKEPKEKTEGDDNADDKEADAEADRMEREVKQKTQQGLLNKYTPSLPKKFPNMGEMKSSLPYFGKGDGKGEKKAEEKAELS